MANAISRALQTTRLVVRGDRIATENGTPPEFSLESADFSAQQQARDMTVQLYKVFKSSTFDMSSDAEFLKTLESPSSNKGINETVQSISSFAARTMGASARVGLGGKLHKGVSLHKGLHKGLHKSGSVGSGASGFSETALLGWPEILPPWRELQLLHDFNRTFKWKVLDDDGLIGKPTHPEQKYLETQDLIDKQNILRRPDNAWRRARIEAEATNDLAAYMTPLGTDASAPSSETATLFQLILWLGNVIGLYYKERFAVERPHVINPAIEPFLPVPTFYSYPSNHAFQSFLIAEVFARTVPEHSGVLALYRAAGQVALNREYAGLHFRSDTKAGQKLARLCAPMIEHVLEEQILRVRKEWY